MSMRTWVSLRSLAELSDPNCNSGRKGERGVGGIAGMEGNLPSASEGQGDQSATRVPARDPETILLDASKLLYLANQAAQKLESMYIRREVEPRVALDDLIKARPALRATRLALDELIALLKPAVK